MIIIFMAVVWVQVSHRIDFFGSMHTTNSSIYDLEKYFSGI